MDFKTLRFPMFAKKQRKRFSLDDNPGFLRIFGGQSFVSNFDQSLIARRQTDFAFEAETKVYYNPENFQQLAGLSYRYDEDSQYNLCITYDEQLGRILQVQAFLPPVNYNPYAGSVSSYSEGMKIQLKGEGPVWLKVTVDNHKAWFSYSEDGTVWRKLRFEVNPDKVSDEFGGLGFTGAFVGMFAVDMQTYSKYADFEYFKYTKN